ncbi:MAG: oxidoreductase [Pyrinomonas sp.]|uniref:Gfo/Idh/MocA family protein n=1 Tax=Pyrinomonas sp. TaxID=2080306 RepID=UPI003328303D
MVHRVGIIGGGNISETHVRAAQTVADVQVAAIYGQARERVHRLAESCGARAYNDLNAFFDREQLDVVLIGSPSGLHATHGIEAARRGIHVLVEKPLDISTARADQLIAECERNGVQLGVFFQDRATPDFCRLKEMIERGELGRLLLASGRVKWYRPPEYYAHSRWRGTWALDGGGALINQAIHTVDLLLWLVGPVARVYARHATLLHDIEVEDTLVATLEFASGALGTLEAATSVYPGYPRRVEITGSQGTVIIEQSSVTAAHLRAGSQSWAANELSSGSATSPVVADASGHRRVLEDFLRAVETGGRPCCDGREGRRSLELVEALYFAARTGQPVSLVDRSAQHSAS